MNLKIWIIGKEILEAGEKAINALDKWEGKVLQTKMETFQDVVNFLNRLNSHMINLLGTIDASDPPLTQGPKLTDTGFIRRME
ncbi:MAG: hypothetical protein CM1200mP1_14320 [Candidatus Neomarinimicrobiota bacterium]|nr:MAG: hypothetical protein CM1200mP1_14320 [Candidatus Neomarinimicrobiota bacterium]